MRWPWRRGERLARNAWKCYRYAPTEIHHWALTAWTMSTGSTGGGEVSVICKRCGKRATLYEAQVVGKRIGDRIEHYRRMAPDVVRHSSYPVDVHTRSRDDVSWALAQARDIATHQDWRPIWQGQED